MSLWSWSYCIVLAVVVPYLSARSLHGSRAEELSRIELYANLCASLWVLAAIGFLVIKLDGQTMADVYVTTAPLERSGAAFVVWTLAMAGGGLLLFGGSHLLRHRLRLPGEETALTRLRPTRAAETIWVLLVISPTAGLCEEFLYRGFFISRVGAIAGSAASPFMAAAAAAAVFGLAHAYQGWLGAVRAGTIALILAIPVVAVGTVLPSMAAHALIDAAGILWLWPLLERRWPVVAGAPAPAP